ncbi:MAG: arginine deiminase family protein [Bacteroidota bacterium]
MIPVKILDETAPLEAVILGIADDFGGVPDLNKTYDPKSREHIKKGTFPNEEALIKELTEVEQIFRKHRIEVFRPQNIKGLNQIFARDISFVVDDQLVVPCVTPERKKESDGIDHITDLIEDVLLPDEHERIEGGDVIPWENFLFVGYSKAEDFEKYTVARTNEDGLKYLQKTFQNRSVRGFELVKSDDDPRNNALHLDCCFQPVGKDKAVIYPNGFKNAEDVDFLRSNFGNENVFEISQEEMYEMNSNFFSLHPKLVLSDSSFHRLNSQFRTWDIEVEEVSYREVAKMEGLFRCTTMPLRRKYV